MTDSSSWKLIRLRSFIPIRSHVRRNSAVVINLEQHDRFVTDKCSMRLTERNRRNYGFYIKPVRDFRKLKRRNIRVWFRPIRSTPGFCGFWKGYRLPSIRVNNRDCVCLFVCLLTCLLSDANVCVYLAFWDAHRHAHRHSTHGSRAETSIEQKRALWARFTLLDQNFHH